MLDLGHLKIASRKLGFMIEDFLCCVSDRAAGIHLHENDGLSDLHFEPLNSKILIYRKWTGGKVVVPESRGLRMERIMPNKRALDQFYNRLQSS